MQASSGVSRTTGLRTGPWLLGLVGGIASGKSAAARMLAERGALWIDCDQLAHRVLEHSDVIEALRQRFSDDILDSQGAVDRRRVAAYVFGDTPSAVAHRHWLEGVVHPRVRQLAEQRIAQAGQQYPAIVIDAPLLIEAGWSDFCDRIVMIDTPVELRRQLAAARGWTDEEFARRERSQLSVEEKRRRSTDVIPNAGSLDELAEQVAHFWQRLLASRT